MPRLQYKRFASPDGERTFPFGSAQVVTLDDATIGLARWEPGWRWSTHLAPIAGTTSCQVHHLGYAISGRLLVVMDDGQSLEIPGGSAYEIPAGHDASVVGDEAFVTLEWTSAHVVGVDVEGGNERILATVLFTDIVGSTAALAAMGDARWRDVLGEHNRRMRDLLNRHRGREIDTTGDGFLALFDSASRAVRCGLAMTAGATDMGIAIRVGIHSGEVELVGDNARGLAVHAAARVLAAAGDSEVLVSETTRDLIEGSGLVLEDAGAHELKGIAGARRLYRVTPPVG
jgi:class 3 adenylate cyclase